MTDIAEFDITHAGRRVSGHGFDAWVAEVRELLKLAGPLALTQLAQMTIMGTDMFMLGHYSTKALASATLGNTIFFFAWLLGFGPAARRRKRRSEEHTSELQSRPHLVCRLLLEKKKHNNIQK